MIDMRNRRKATRLPVNIPVDYLGKEFLGKNTVINVSPYGVLIHGDYLSSSRSCEYWANSPIYAQTSQATTSRAPRCSKP